MTAPTPARRRKRRYDGLEFDRMALAALYQHRLATSRQLYDLLGPFTTGEGTGEREDHSFPASRLRGLRAAGLLDHVTRHFPGRTRTWFLTEAGRTLAGTFPELQDRISPPQSLTTTGAQLLAAHTHDVLQAHLAFLADARQRGDEYGPLDWAPEVYHRISERSNDAIKADALMYYTLTTPRGRVHLRSFIELDRCTMSSEKLSSKLISYARFHHLAPVPLRLRGTTEAQGVLELWKDHYAVFPRLLFILTGGSATTMRHRIEDLQLAAREDARVVSMLRTVPAGAATLDDIAAQGPSAPVWTSLAHPDRPACSWADL